MKANVTHLQKRQRGGLRKVQASQPHFDPQEVDGVAIPGKHCQAHEGGQKNVASMDLPGEIGA